MVDEDFAWRLAQELVRIESSDPGAYEDEIERFIKRLIEQQLAQLDSSALDAVQIEELEVLPGRRNLKVTVPGQSDEPRLIYICHMDTVTLGDGWDADIAPLGAVVRDDKLYGRGACDMKGGLACAIAALVHTLERVAADGALPRPRLFAHLLGRRGRLHARLRGRDRCWLGRLARMGAGHRTHRRTDPGGAQGSHVVRD